jgi:DNA-binding CsgD family transcriptional regulator
MSFPLEKSFKDRRESIESIIGTLRKEAADLRAFANELEETANNMTIRIKQEPDCADAQQKHQDVCEQEPKDVCEQEQVPVPLIPPGGMRRRGRPRATGRTPVDLSVRKKIEQLLLKRGSMRVKDITEVLKLNRNTVSGTLSEYFKRVGYGLWSVSNDSRRKKN